MREDLDKYSSCMKGNIQEFEERLQKTHDKLEHEHQKRFEDTQQQIQILESAVRIFCPCLNKTEYCRTVNFLKT